VAGRALIREHRLPRGGVAGCARLPVGYEARSEHQRSQKDAQAEYGVDERCSSCLRGR
jgi:hypothetical protein